MKRTLEKLARWERASVWDRIGITFTKRELVRLEADGHIVRGLFGSFNLVRMEQEATR